MTQAKNFPVGNRTALTVISGIEDNLSSGGGREAGGWEAGEERVESQSSKREGRRREMQNANFCCSLSVQNTFKKQELKMLFDLIHLASFETSGVVIYQNLLLG